MRRLSFPSSGGNPRLEVPSNPPASPAAPQERKLFDERFIRALDTRRLCELTSAADSLDMTPLVDLTSRGLARLIEGKTPEEIRDTFHLPDDLTGARGSADRNAVGVGTKRLRAIVRLDERRPAPGYGADLQRLSAVMLSP